MVTNRKVLNRKVLLYLTEEGGRSVEDAARALGVTTDEIIEACTAEEITYCKDCRHWVATEDTTDMYTDEPICVDCADVYDDY